MARGHKRKRGDAWELRISAGSDPLTGRRRIITRTFRGPAKAADKELTRLLVELDGGAHKGPDATLGTLMDRWWSHSRSKWAPATRRGYATYRRTYLADHAERRIADVTPEWLDALYANLSERLAPATVYKVHTMLHDALDDAVRWGWLAWNPADRAEAPTVKRRPVMVPKRAVVKAAVATLAEQDPDFAAMLHLRTVVGPRRAELLGFQWGDLHDGALTVRRTVVYDEKGKVIVQADTKSHRARRIELDPGTLAVLEDMRLRAKDRAAALDVDLGDAFLFPRSPAEPHRPASPGQIDRRWARWRTRLGLEGVKPHAFRHAMVTHLLDQGIPVHDVAARAGHANANVTLAIYTHPTTEGARRAGDAAGL